MPEYSAEGWDYSDLLDSTYQYKPWIVDGLFTEATQVLLAAPPNIGKSVFLQQMTCCIATGTPFLGMSVPEAKRVLYLQAEGDLGETVKRGREMSKLVKVPPKGSVRWEYLLLGQLNTKRGRDALDALCDQFALDNGVVIIDPLYATIKGSMSEDAPASEYVATLNHIIQKYKSTVVVCHHEHRPIRNVDGKKVKEGAGEAVFGSFVWGAWTSFGLQLQYTSGRASVELVNWKRRRPTPLMDTPIDMHMVEPTPLGFLPVEEGLSRADLTVRELLRYMGQWMTKAEITEVLSRERTSGVRQTQVQKSVERLFELNLLEVEETITNGGKGRPSIKYKLKEGLLYAV